MALIRALSGSGGGGYALTTKSLTLTRNIAVTVETGLPKDFGLFINHSYGTANYPATLIVVQNGVVAESSACSNCTITYDGATGTVSVNQNFTNGTTGFTEYLFTK